MPSFYGDDLFILQSALSKTLSKIDLIRNYRKMKGLRDPVEHCKGRIKSQESMLEKLNRKGLEATLDNAIHEIHDAVGVRIVCKFVDDVYEMAALLKSMDDLTVIEEKDYIGNPKPNGYRSYHLIVMERISMPTEVREIPVEIQIRTIAQDSWAALEHQLGYKQNLQNVDLIKKELKRCADEMASTDLTMQTVRQMIHKEM